MDHGPAVKLGKDYASPQKTKLGVILFFVYLLIYSGFVAIALAKPSAMSVSTILGLNLACFYGFGLIILAIVMGLVYNHICTGLEFKLNKPDAAPEEPQQEKTESIKPDDGADENVSEETGKEVDK